LSSFERHGRDFEILQNPLALKSAPIRATTFSPDPALEGLTRLQWRALARQRAKHSAGAHNHCHSQLIQDID
jgi:hypothetical protein